MTGPDSLRRQVALLLLGMILLATVVAGAGAIGVTSLSEDVDALVHDLRPAAASNDALRHDMQRAQDGAWGFVLTEDGRFLDQYHAAVTSAEDELLRLERLVHVEREGAEAVAAQAVALTAWVDFSARLVRSDGGSGSDALLPQGQDRFDRFAVANDELSNRLAGTIDTRGEVARERARLVIILVALLALIGLVVTALLGRAVVRKVSGPMQEMERGVARLAAGDLTVRVATDGPREMRGVALALNTLAEENQRSRRMEQQVVDQLKQLDRSKDEFVSTVSHELRTPLTSIAGYIELFEDDLDELTPHQARMLRVVTRNVERLRSLIEDLLTLSRVESDAFRTTFDLVDMSGLTSEAAHDVAEIAARADLRVRESGPGGPVMVRGDAGQVSRAILNLLTNAIKFSPAGNEVLIALSEVDGEAVVSVVDRGMGIPAKELATLGTRFFRASNAVEAEITGTGLGLRIVQTIADNHGGRLELDSTEGEGTIARLSIPVALPSGPGGDMSGGQVGRATGNNVHPVGITEG